MLENINRFDDCYQIIKNKKSSKITNFITVLLIVLIIFLFYFFFYKFEQTKTYYGTITKIEDESYVICKISSINEFIYFTKTDSILVVDNEEVDYEIVDVINNYDYYEVILKLQLNYEPRITKLKFILKEKTLFEKMKEDLYGKNFKQ